MFRDPFEGEVFLSPEAARRLSANRISDMLRAHSKLYEDVELPDANDDGLDTRSTQESE